MQDENKTPSCPLWFWPFWALILGIFVIICTVLPAATLRVSNYSLYNVVVYDQVSMNPVDDTGRVTLIDPLAPVSQTDFTIADEALIRIRLKEPSTGDNYINTWRFVRGDTRIDISQNGSALIVDTPPIITVTNQDENPLVTMAPDAVLLGFLIGQFVCFLFIGGALIVKRSS